MQHFLIIIDFFPPNIGSSVYIFIPSLFPFLLLPPSLYSLVFNDFPYLIVFLFSHPTGKNLFSLSVVAYDQIED